jgi:hypothetical protein
MLPQWAGGIMWSSYFFLVLYGFVSVFLFEQRGSKTQRERAHRLEAETEITETDTAGRKQGYRRGGRQMQ